MKHATRLGRLAGEAATFFVNFAHGGLLAAGLVAVAVGVPRIVQQEPVSFSDTGVTEVLPAAPAPAPMAALPPETAAAPAMTAAPRRGKLSVEMRRVRDYIARRYHVSPVALEPVLSAAEASGHRVGLDPLLIVAVMAVESSFNPFAESQLGAQGLMQVMPRFHMDKIGSEAGADALFDPQLNIKVGTEILRDGLRRFGDLEAALQYYGGALDDPAAAYAQKVLSIKDRLAGAARRAGTSSAGV